VRVEKTKSKTDCYSVSCRRLVVTYFINTRYSPPTQSDFGLVGFVKRQLYLTA